MEATRPFEPEKCDLAAAVRAVLAVPEAQVDYAQAKLELDGLIDPSLDNGATLRELDRMATAAKLLAGPETAPDRKLAALRKLLYQSGPWNDFRPFAYDHGDPEGTHIPNKLLHVYLERRLGNCVSMPVLFLILAERLGLDMALARAPLHLFLRHRLPDGRSINIEATSGGHPARDDWYRQCFPMSDRAIESGLYMRALSRREGAALMATTLLEQLAQERRCDEAIAVAAVILAHDSSAGDVMVMQGSAYGQLLAQEFEARFPIPFLIPEALRPRRLLLMERNNALIRAAEMLGWEPTEEPKERKQSCTQI